ncbi:MAG: N-acetylmuramoyl-L-alanine amidase [Mangrovibacterium sp.]|nr:N-acetylmuramoyl-L-alanine amidase [Mangrovibacterium sp.]
MESKRWLFLRVFLFTLFVGHVTFAGYSQGKAFTVVIDAGHGGQDPGAVYRNIREKDVVLRLALKLGSYIKQNMPDTKVIYTRDRDVFIPLHRRAAIANSSKADLFISLHANYCSTPSISGTETFVLGLHRSKENLEVAKKENAVILMEEDYTTRYEGFDPNLPESYIMFEMVQDEYLNQSIMIGALMQEQFKNRAARKDRGVKQAGFLVLRKIGMPGILVEAGFLSNSNEAQYLNSERGQTSLATAICQAFKLYKSAVETRSDFRLVAQGRAEENVNPVVSEGEGEVAEEPKAIPEQAVDEGIYFSVQLAVTSSRTDPTPANFKGLQPVYVIPYNGRYKYLYARERSYREIQKKNAEARRFYPDAFVVAFKNGKQVPLKSVLNQEKR